MSNAPERIWLYVDSDDQGERYLELIRPDAECSTDVPYILATPTALAASPEVQRMIREAEARVAGRALDIITSGTFDASDPRIDALADLAEAAAIRGEGK